MKRGPKKIKKRKYKIYVFRHGRTHYNVKGKFTGHKHTRLTWKGKQDAKILAKSLKNKTFHTAFYTSLPRSKQTLNYVLKYHPECKELIVDDRMIERSYGILEGTTHKSFIKKIGKQALNLRKEGDALENLKPKMRRKAAEFLGKREYDAVHRGYEVKVPQGESFLDVEKRVRSFINYLKKYIKKNKVNVAISAHGNSIRLFRKIMEGATREQTVKWFIPYDKYFEYTIEA